MADQEYRPQSLPMPPAPNSWENTPAAIFRRKMADMYGAPRPVPLDPLSDHEKARLNARRPGSAQEIEEHRRRIAEAAASWTVDVSVLNADTETEVKLRDGVFRPTKEALAEQAAAHNEQNRRALEAAYPDPAERARLGAALRTIG